MNLGIKVPPEELIKAYREHKPDAIGLSGLLVKARNRWWSRRATSRTQEWEYHCSSAALHCPRNITTGKIAPTYNAPTFYAKDAMTGLRIMNEIMDPALREETRGRHLFDSRNSRNTIWGEGECRDDPQREGARRSSHPVCPLPGPSPSDITAIAGDLEHINPFMLYGRHWASKATLRKSCCSAMRRRSLSSTRWKRSRKKLCNG